MCKVLEYIDVQFKVRCVRLISSYKKEYTLLFCVSCASSLNLLFHNLNSQPTFIYATGVIGWLLHISIMEPHGERLIFLLLISIAKGKPML